MKKLLFCLLFLCSVSVFAEFDGDPLYIHTSDTNGASFYAWRPFYSHYVEDDERWRKDYLWPLYTRKGFKHETYSRFLFFGYSTDFGRGDGRNRTWVIPFYYKGTSEEGEDYFAVFPFGGSIHEFLGRDEVSFVLWPMYVKSHVNDAYTTTWLWPVASRTTGSNTERFRVWPFYSENELKGEFKKKSVMWPIYSSVQYTNERNPGGGFILIPVYGRIETEKADNWWIIPPFFRYMSSEEQWFLHAPWPFVQLADGELHKRVFWPFYGRKELGTQTKQYWAWPILWNNETRYAMHKQNRKFIVPFWTHQVDTVTRSSQAYDAGDVRSRYWKLWPLMSYERNAERSRFRMLDLWPLRNTPGIERNWAPWWTLYRRMNVEGETGHHVLWGLYRQTKSSEAFEWSLLKGFVGYKKEQDDRSYRFLFMRFGEDEGIEP